MKTLKQSCVLAVAFSAMLGVAGCDVAPKNQDIDTALKLCEQNGGVTFISGESSVFNGRTKCKNGAYFYFADGKAVGSDT